MKKKIILIPILAIIILVIALLGYFIWDNRTTSIITLDINPSIKIKLNKNNEVKKIIPINKDAKKIAIIIGPEGGISKEEVESLVNDGAKEVSLGKRILRTETASISSS